LPGEIVFLGIEAVPHLAELPVVGEQYRVQRRASQPTQQVLVEQCKA